MQEPSAIITNDAVILGILMIILAFVFRTSSSHHPFWRSFYTYIPALLLCYFLPSVLSTWGVIPGEGGGSNLYKMASDYLLPASLVLLTLSIDFKGIIKLGPKAIIMFLTGTVGIVIGGPIAILLVSYFSPELVGGAGPDAVWRGMTTIAGSWIGGGANQAAMKVLFEPSGPLFSIMATVDVIVANIWMAFLLFGAGRANVLDKKLKADNSAIEDLKVRIETYRESIKRYPNLTDTMMILGIGFGATAIAHFFGVALADWLTVNAPFLESYSLTKKFFWVVVIATSIGLGLSFTSFKAYEGAGASRIGSALLYVLIATIGMQMNLKSIYENYQMFILGLVWMSVHVILLLTVAKIIRAPFFFVAVGSQANVGGAASAPVVASAFHPSLAPVGVLLAVFGYALGTYGAYICGLLMQLAAEGTIGY